MLAHPAAEIQPSAGGKRLCGSRTRHSFVVVARFVPRLASVPLETMRDELPARRTMDRRVFLYALSEAQRSGYATGILDVDRGVGA
jgi:hypothetical protein